MAAGIVMLCLAVAPCLSSSPRTGPHLGQTSSAHLADPTLQRLADDYFTAYSHKNLEGMISLWSGGSPGLESQRKQLHDWFVATSALTASDESVDSAEIDPTHFKLTLQFRIKASNEPATEPRRSIHTLTCVREGKTWKIWSDVEEFTRLAETLINAKNETERSAVLRENAERVSPELVVAFLPKIQSLESQGDFDQAFRVATMAEQIAESMHDQIGIGLALLEFGFIQQSRGQYDDALASYQKVETIADETRSQWLAAAAIGSTGTVFRRQGRLREALENEQRCLPMFEALGDKEKVSYRLSDLGMTYLKLGDYDAAAIYLQRSLALFEERDDRSGIAFITTNLGILYAMRSDNTRALQYSKQALALSEQTGNKPNLAALLGNIGSLYQTQNDYAQAADYYKRSLTLTRQMGDPVGEAITLQNLGGIYTRTRNWETALQYLRQGMAIFEREKMKDGMADCLASIGNIYEHRQQFPQARERYVKSLALNREIGEQERIAESLIELADNDNAQGNPTQALESSTPSCAIAHQMNDRSNIMSCRTSMGESYRLLHQPEQAGQAFDEAIAAVESMRQDIAGGEQQAQSFLDPSIATPYQDMVELLTTEKQPARALNYAERGKARALLDVVQSGHARIDRVMTSSDRETEQRMQIQLASLNSQIAQERSEAKQADLKSELDKARLQLDDFETELYSRYPELTVQRGRASPITVEEASALPFDDQTAVLEFMVGENETILLVLSRETPAAGLSVSAYRIAVEGEELGRQAREFREQMAGRQLGFQSAARRLHDLLLQPAAAQLVHKTALIIVPDGGLWNLPFQALLDPARHYLLETYSIAYVASLTVLREMVRKQRAIVASDSKPRLLVMANPVFAKQSAASASGGMRGGGLEPLPNAEAETRALVQLYGAEHSRVYTGAQATKSRFKAEADGYNLLHFATHGFMDDSSPMYSSLLLSRADARDDGILEAREIMNLDLRADLVVLSACETARGHVGQGEGMIGLTWAFFAAGVPTTVASQWRVESQSTAELMTAFHRARIAEKSHPNSFFATAKALRQAALQLSHKPQFAHPFYWAPFVVVGDPE